MWTELVLLNLRPKFKSNKNFSSWQIKIFYLDLILLFLPHKTAKNQSKYFFVIFKQKKKERKTIFSMYNDHCVLFNNTTTINNF